jgi:hypothetical protein
MGMSRRERTLEEARLRRQMAGKPPFRSGLSVRKLRDCLRHPSHPLPHHRVDGKIWIWRSEFDVWIAAYHWVGDTEVDQIVDDLLAKLD